MHITGACHCGAVRYRAVVDPARVSICHCTDCQRLTGTAYRVSVGAQRSDVVVERGEPRVYVKTGDSGAQRAQAFCGDCGSPLFTWNPATPERCGLRVGCIDQRRELLPRRQIWCRSALPWSMDLTALPQSDGE